MVTFMKRGQSWAGYRLVAVGWLVGLGWLGLIASAPANGQGLPDPMRPAHVLASPDGNGNGNGNGEAVSGELRLQSILLSPRRKLAVINGQSVRLGEKYGDAVLVKLTAGEAVLKTGDQLQTLKLFAALEKKKAATGKGAPTTMKDQ